jgi:hypothetical protein
MIRPVSPTRPPRGSETGTRYGPDLGPPGGTDPARGRRSFRRAPKPVFVDRSGRRHRVVVASGAAAGVLVLLALAMLVAGLFGASPVPLPGLPDLDGQPATQPATGPSASLPTADASGAEPTESAPSGESSGTAESTSPRHVPTQTPSRDQGRPTKT